MEWHCNCQQVPPSVAKQHVIELYSKISTWDLCWVNNIGTLHSIYVPKQCSILKDHVLHQKTYIVLPFDSEWLLGKKLKLKWWYPTVLEWDNLWIGIQHIYIYIYNKSPSTVHMQFACRCLLHVRSQVVDRTKMKSLPQSINYFSHTKLLAYIYAHEVWKIIALH